MSIYAIPNSIRLSDLQPVPELECDDSCIRHRSLISENKELKRELSRLKWHIIDGDAGIVRHPKTPIKHISHTTTKLKDSSCKLDATVEEESSDTIDEDDESLKGQYLSRSDESEKATLNQKQGIDDRLQNHDKHIYHSAKVKVKESDERGRSTTSIDEDEESFKAHVLLRSDDCDKAMNTKQIVRPNVHKGNELLGELSFQLERRILEFVFSEEKEPNNLRFYGFSVYNIKEMLFLQHQSGNIDARQKTRGYFRIQHIQSVLSTYNFNFNIHARFCLETINKYGVLEHDTKVRQARQYSEKNLGPLLGKVGQLCEGAECEHMGVIIACLAYMSQQQGGGLFRF